MPNQTYLINVTATDIARGKRHDTELCPIARAAKRRFRTATRATYDRLLVDQGGSWMVVFPVPYEVGDFMEDFDSLRKVAPFKFEVGGPHV